MLGLGLKIPRMIINSYFSGNSPLSFNLGTAPTQVLAASGTGDESTSIRPLQFFEYDASTWGLLYLADGGGSTSRTIKLATSAKSGFAHSWTKQGTVIAAGTSGAWDESIGSASVVKNGSTWIVLYESFIDGGKVGAATGTDLLSLTKHASNPLIDNSASNGFNKYLRHPNAIIVDSTLYCIYEGRPYSPGTSTESKIGYATAPLSDITDWTVSSTVLIDPSNIGFAKGNFSTIINPQIKKIDDYYYMWFQAFPTDGQNEDYLDISLGGSSYAYSKDLLNWTLVGDNNYHVYMGLFGYNTSSSFYEYFQEVTPVYDGTDLVLYGWSLTSSNIMKIDLNGAAFSNTFRGFDVQDSFDDDSIDTGIWTNNGGTGITISETGGDLVISKSGTDVQAYTTVFESIDTWNNDDGVIVCGFTIDISDHNSTDLWLFELSDSGGANTDVIRIVRSTTTDECNFVVRANNNAVTNTAIPFTGKDSFKFVIDERNRVKIYRSDNAIGWTVIYNQKLTGANEIENTTWKFKVGLINSVSSANTIKLKNIAIGKYDSGLVGTFDNTSILEVISIDTNYINATETKDFIITGAGFTGCTLSITGNATLNSYEVVSNTHITANITASASYNDTISFVVDNGTTTDSINITAYDIPTANITHYYPLTANSTDSVGVLDGSDTDISYTTVGGKLSASFNASTSVIDFGDNDDFSFGDGSTDSAFTFFIELYIRNLPIGGTVHFPILKREGTTLREYAISYDDTGDLFFGVFDQSASANIFGFKNTAVSTGSWYRMIFKYNPTAGDYTDMVIKIDETPLTLSGSSTGTYTAMENQTSPLKLGKRWDGVVVNAAMRNFTIINKFTTDDEDNSIGYYAYNGIPFV